MIFSLTNLNSRMFKQTAGSSGKIKANLSDMVIRPVKDNEMMQLVSLAGEVGWGDSYNEETFQIIKNLDLDCQGLFVAEYKPTGEIVGSIGVINLDDEQCYVQFLVVKSSYRGIGVGTKLLTAGFAKGSNRNVILYSTDESVQFYCDKEYCTIKSHVSHLVQGKINFSKLSAPSLNNVNIAPFDEKDLGMIHKYDMTVHDVPRETVLKMFLSHSKSYAFVAKKENEVVGYINALPVKEGYHLFPWSADTPSIASGLFYEVAKCLKSHDVIFADILVGNEHARAIAKTYGWNETTTITRMYSKPPQSDLLVDKIYSLSFGGLF